MKTWSSGLEFIKSKNTNFFGKDFLFDKNHWENWKYLAGMSFRPAIHTKINYK